MEEEFEKQNRPTCQQRVKRGGGNDDDKNPFLWLQGGNDHGVDDEEHEVWDTVMDTESPGYSPRGVDVERYEQEEEEKSVESSSASSPLLITSNTENVIAVANASRTVATTTTTLLGPGAFYVRGERERVVVVVDGDREHSSSASEEFHNVEEDSVPSSQSSVTTSRQIVEAWRVQDVTSQDDSNDVEAKAQERLAELLRDAPVAQVQDESFNNVQSNDKGNDGQSNGRCGQGKKRVILASVSLLLIIIVAIGISLGVILPKRGTSSTPVGDSLRTGPEPCFEPSSTCPKFMTGEVQAAWWNWAECNRAFIRSDCPPQDKLVPDGWLFLAGAPPVPGGVSRNCTYPPGTYKYVALPLLNFGCYGASTEFRNTICARQDAVLQTTVENKTASLNGADASGNICYFRDCTVLRFHGCACDVERCPGILDLLVNPCDGTPEEACAPCDGVDITGNGWFALWQDVTIEIGAHTTFEQTSVLDIKPAEFEQFPDGALLSFNVRYNITGGNIPLEDCTE